ncbi:MAG: beta-N-acetylhexosaminidase [Eubacteriales bacterium]
MKNFEYFGVMIDCSRNAVPNIEALCEFLSVISKMGYNFAMLYTEDTYEVDGQPFFGYKRGKYTKEELRKIDAYAASVGIELIPCIQTLAHLNGPMRWNCYRDFRDCDDILLVGDERTYKLIDDMFASLSSCIRSRKIHIGLDEAYNVGLGQYLEKNGYHEKYDVLLSHLERVCDIAKKYGYEPMMWEDMFFRAASGTYNSGAKEKDSDNIDFPEEIKAKIPENLSMVYWDYYGETAEKYKRMIRSSKSLCERVWFAGGAWCWAGFTPHNDVSMRRNALALSECTAAGIKNVFLTLWGDNGGECPIFNVLPALMHAASIAEGMSEAEMKARFKEITGADFDDMLKLDLPNYIYGKNIAVGTANYSKNRLYNDPFLGIADLNAENPVNTDIFKKHADALRLAGKRSGAYEYLFETQASLCDILSIKFDLGNITRALYKAGDKKALLCLAQNEYTECITLIEKFYSVFRSQWYKVNKTYGFEIQDIRLGGLIMRMKNCRERLIDYAEGKISDIPELSEAVLPHGGGNIADWHKMVSANQIVSVLI